MELLLVIFASTGFWSFLQYIIDTRIKKRGETLSNVASALENITALSIAMARDRINFLCNKYLELGYIPKEEFDSFIAIGDCYIMAGGNSVVREKFEHCKNLEIK